LQLLFAIQQAPVALDALEGIVGLAILVETEVVLVGLFVFELVHVPSDNNADIEMEEEANHVANDETDFSARAEDRTTRDLVVVAVVTLNQRALGEDEVECKSGQGQRREEAQPNENRVGFDHATVSDHRANEPEKRDKGNDSENRTSDDDTDSSAGRDFDLVVVQEIWSCINGVDEPEECTRSKPATDEGQQR